MDRARTHGVGSRPTRLSRPTFASEGAYAACLDDLGFWAPYVAEVLARHRLPWDTPAVGSVGSFPTFLVGRYVVKLFGEYCYGAECHAAEQSVQRLLLGHPEIPAPMLIAEGALFEDGRLGDAWPWPYLIMTRMRGRAWCDAALSPFEGASVARQLGQVMRRVHALPPPAGRTWERDWLGHLRARCAGQHRERGMLPEHLVEQIPAYLAEPSEVRRVVHADLHAHHVFVDGGRLIGVIDWGDAFLADPYYDLPALHLLTFRGDKNLLRAFLDGYGWDIGPEFAHRAMSITLVHEFNPLGGIRDMVDVAAVATLDELASLLWALS